MPRWTRKLSLRLRSFFRSRNVEVELDEEIRFHLENQVAEHVKQGMSPQEARFEALREMGGIEQHKEECRDALGVCLIRDLFRDVRYSLRQLRRAPGFTVAAVLTLALGIGANTTIFQLLDRIVLRPLPVRNPQQLVRLQGYQNGRRQGFTYPLLREMIARQTTLQGVFASGQFRIKEVRVGSRALSQLQYAWAATPNYFRLIGTEPQIGRFFDDADDMPDSPPVAVISDRLWRTEFAGQSNAVGSTIYVNGVSLTIVGITRPEFFGESVGTNADLWVPIHLIGSLSSPTLLKSSVVWLYPMGRLRPDVPLAQAQSEISLLWDSLKQYGMQFIPAGGYSLVLIPTPQGIGGLDAQFSQPLWLLMGIVAIVALIACCNLANILLARATARAQEMSVRLALGAGRVRLIRQLLTESLVLSTLGGGVGLALAALASGRLVSLASAGEPLQISTSIDWRVAGFNLVVTLASAFLFGVAPAFSATRTGLNLALQTASRTLAGGRSRHAAAKAFVVAQVALSLVLTAGAALLVRSFWKIVHQDLGFRPEGVLVAIITADTDASFKAVLDASKHLAIARHLGEVPGVRIAASAVAGPLGTVSNDVTIALPGRTLPLGDVNEVLVGPGYFDAMGISLIAGRPIIDEDRKDSPTVAVLSESAARLMFGKRNPVGSRFSQGKQFDERNTIEVVGVVRDLRYSSLRAPFGPLVFYPVTQKFVFSGPTIVLRTEGDPLRFADEVRKAVRGVAPSLRVSQVGTLQSVIETDARRERLLAWLSGAFGVLAVILAAVGLYGVVAYTSQGRTSEIGVRLALGARPSQIHALLLREAIFLTVVGLTIGCAIAFLFTARLGPLLFDLAPQDPATFAFSMFLLAAVAVVAAYIPAYRAARLDPSSALRSE